MTFTCHRSANVPGATSGKNIVFSAVIPVTYHHQADQDFFAIFEASPLTKTEGYALRLIIDN